MAGRLIISWRPTEAPAESSPEDAALWSELYVAVETRVRRFVLTQVYDSRSKTTRDRVSDSMLPFAGWVARNWAHLVVADRVQPPNEASRRIRYNWQRSHDLRFAGDGTALPPLRFIPLDEEHVLLRWNPSLEDDGLPIRFLTSAPAEDEPQPIVPTESLRTTLQRFVDEVLRRLNDCAPNGTETAELRASWEQAMNRAHPDFEPIRLAARAGLRWLDLSPEQRQVLVTSAQNTAGLTQIIEALRSTEEEPELKEALDFAALAKTRCDNAPMAPQRWKDLVQQLQHPSNQSQILPWQAGWAAAKNLRDVLGLPQDRIGFTPAIDLGFSLEDGGPPSLEVDSFVSWSPGRVPVRWHRRHHDDRFAQTRDLYVALFDGNPSAAHARSFSRTSGGIGPIARAFAAELLAPLKAIESRLPRSGRLLDEDIAEIAADLPAPELCVRHQVENRLQQ